VNDPASRDLLGFLLGALETDEYQHMEATIEHDHHLKEQLQDLRDEVSPLDQLDPPGLPPAGLARRTCEFVATRPRSETGQAVAGKERRRWFSERIGPPAGLGHRSAMDLVIVAVLLMLLAAIALPALNSSRYHSRLLACQENLRTVGTGILQYADNSGGKYFRLPESGNLAFAGFYASELLDRGLVSNPDSFLCAGAGADLGQRIPTLQQLLAARGPRLRQLQKQAGGDFAATMGYWNNRLHEAGENRNRGDFILIADRPGVSLPGRASSNHGGYGQNAFFEDGHFRFLEVPELDGDAIYENDWGNVGPGAHVDDIVLVPSATRLGNFRVD
jgi:hypothetical protein